MAVDAPDGLAEAVLVVVIFGAILYVGLGAWGSIAAGIDGSGGALDSFDTATCAYIVVPVGLNTSHRVMSPD